MVDNRDLSKESTVGGLQYIRRDGSGYDRANNPEQMASATPLLGVSLNEQNPKLTNIVLARRDLDYKDGEAVRAQFAGGTDVEPLTAAGKPREDDSLQVENFKNVDVLAGAFKQVGSAKFSDPNNRLDGTTHNIDTHIQNNTDKDGEFTRERVTHVFTPRYEYRQPYVDYPHAANQADIGKEHAANQGGPVGTSFRHCLTTPTNQSNSEFPQFNNLKITWQIGVTIRSGQTGRQGITTIIPATLPTSVPIKIMSPGRFITIPTAMAVLSKVKTTARRMPVDIARPPHGVMTGLRP